MADIRQLITLELPLPENMTVAHPEAVVVKVPGTGAAVDLGALCYSRRTGRKAVGGGRGVALDSLQPSRLPIVRAALERASHLTEPGNRRPAGVYQELYALGRFVEWADATGRHTALDSVTNVAEGFREFVRHLRERVAHNKLSTNSAAGLQNGVLSILSEVFQTEDLSHGVNLLQRSRAASSPTSPPNEEEQAKLLAISKALFEGLGELSAGFKPYPYALRVPPYLGAMDDTLWTFPTTHWCEPPHRKGDADKERGGAFDYTNGGLLSIKAIAARLSPKKPKWGSIEAIGRHKAKTRLSAAQASLAEANANPNNRYRHYAGQLAHNAFVLLFLAHTGINWSVVRELPWAEDYEVTADRQGFRSIKFRAAGRLVSFEIQPVFLPLFKRFLRLRAYLLQGRDCPWLFIGFGKRRDTLGQMSLRALDSYFDALRNLDPATPVVMSKQWRAAKSDWLVRNTDPATTALILQNSESTVLRSYTAGSESRHMEEMSAFFQGVSSVVLARDTTVPGGVENAIGVCSSFGHPAARTSGPIETDCKRPEGCLFCDKFRVHADERDVRKLLSCHYCVSRTAPLAASAEQFEALFGDVLRRIEQLLTEITTREPGLVPKVRQEVEVEGELDPYWASKLELLFNLELVA